MANFFMQLFDQHHPKCCWFRPAPKYAGIILRIIGHEFCENNPRIIGQLDELSGIIDLNALLEYLNVTALLELSGRVTLIYL